MEEIAKTAQKWISVADWPLNKIEVPQALYLKKGLKESEYMYSFLGGMKAFNFRFTPR